MGNRTEAVLSVEDQGFVMAEFKPKLFYRIFRRSNEKKNQFGLTSESFEYKDIVKHIEFQEKLGNTHVNSPEYFANKFIVNCLEKNKLPDGSLNPQLQFELITHFYFPWKFANTDELVGKFGQSRIQTEKRREKIKLWNNKLIDQAQEKFQKIRRPRDSIEHKMKLIEKYYPEEKQLNDIENSEKYDGGVIWDLPDQFY